MYLATHFLNIILLCTFIGRRLDWLIGQLSLLRSFSLETSHRGLGSTKHLTTPNPVLHTCKHHICRNSTAFVFRTCSERVPNMFRT